MLDSIVAIKRAVKESGGIMTLNMETLRNAYGAGKIGKHVLSGISKELAGQGLAHFPLELPNYQHEVVRIYQLGSPVADIIDAASQVGEDNDELLRSAAAGDEANLLRQVRELVCN